MRKIRKGDEVVVLTGKDKGKIGKVLRLQDDATRVVVEGVNLVRKTVKANPEANEEGGFRWKEAALDISNVALYNPDTKKPERVGFKILENGDKVRCFKSNGALVDAK